MTAEQWNEMKQLYLKASTLRLSEGLRYVKSTCADSTVRTEVESLLLSTIGQESSPETQWDPLRYPQGHRIETFEVLQLLGSGGAGAVYKVRDLTNNAVVALKLLYRDDSEFLLRFKSEFRTLRNIRHNNVVTLFTLFSNEDQWFFTMELVQGVPFVHFARSAVRFQALSSANDEDRLHPALCQLASGVNALHETGNLHRDLSPSNVLVTEERRVVILDMGLARNLNDRHTHNSILAGRPAYMAPELALSEMVTKAADWYSVGAILYECLVGRPPYPDSFISLCSRREQPRPERPRDINPYVPADLDWLCMQLLEFEPLNRPCATDILNYLAQYPKRLSQKALKHPRTPFIGRSRHLAVLREAFNFTRQYGAAIVLVTGRSGTGKTALVEEFEQELFESCPDALVLTGTCHQSEAVPFKALDRCIDGLYRYLWNYPRSAYEALIPASFSYVVRLFPVFASIINQCSHVRELPTIIDRQELRKRGFSSLLELLSRIADRAPIVIRIDDLQWGDLDSSSLIARFLSSANPPSILAVASYRAEDAHGSEFLQAIQPSIDSLSAAVKRFDVVIEDFDDAEASALLRSIVGTAVDIPDNQSDLIVHECSGNAFLLEQWARFLLTVRTVKKSEPCLQSDPQAWPALTDIVGARLSGLSEGERHVLDVVAVAGRPVLESVVCAATGPKDLTPRTLADLIHGRFLRVRDKDRIREVDLYHDKLRTVILEQMTEERLCALHKQIALAMELSREPDEALLAIHLREAGEASAAREYAERAADKAARALAFNRAASLYQVAIDCQSDPYEAAPLLVKRGDVLVMAGRGLEAAECYCRAGDLSGRKGESLTFQQKAAEQFLRSGHVERGVAILTAVSDQMHVRLATSQLGLIKLPWRYFRRKAFGLRFKECPVQHVDPVVLARLDAYWAFVIGFSMVDMSRAAIIASKHLALALRAGEPSRIALSLIFDTGLNFIASPSYRLRIWQQAREIGLRLNNQRVIGSAAMLEGSSAILAGSFRRAVTISDEAEQVFLQHCTGVAWELTNARLFSLVGLAWQGLWEQFTTKVEPILADARDRGDLYAMTQLTLGSGLTWRDLALDRPVETEAAVRNIIREWPETKFDLPHFWAYYSLTEVELYQGEGQRAWQSVSKHWSLLSRMLLLKPNFFTVTPLYLRGKAALAAAAASAVPPRRKHTLLRIAASCATRISRAGASWGDGLSALLRAGVASTSGDLERAVQELAAAEAAFVTAEMNMHASVAQLRRGQVLSGQSGSTLIESAKSKMYIQRVLRPEAIANMLAPGRWDQ